MIARLENLLSVSWNHKHLLITAGYTEMGGEIYPKSREREDVDVEGRVVPYHDKPINQTLICHCDTP